MLNMFCDAYRQTARQVDGASQRRFRIKGRRRRTKDVVLTTKPVDIEAALLASYEAAARYAEATGFPHAKRRAESAYKRMMYHNDVAPTPAS